MSSKPRKAFDGVARPQGFIDDTAKAALKAVKRATSRYSVMRGPLRRNVKDSIKGAGKKDNVVLNMYASQYKKSNIRGTQFPKNQSLSPRKFDKIYGKGSAKEVAEQTKRNSRMTADQRVRMRERDENIRANFYRTEGAPRIKKKFR